jgi:hypothetical protein
MVTKSQVTNAMWALSPSYCRCQSPFHFLSWFHGWGTCISRQGRNHRVVLGMIIFKYGIMAYTVIWMDLLLQYYNTSNCSKGLGGSITGKALFESNNCIMT